MIMNGNASLLWWNHTYERILLWFVGLAKRNGLDKVMRPRVFMFVTALMTLSVIRIQSIGILVYLSWLLICFICLVVMRRTFGNDTCGIRMAECSFSLTRMFLCVWICVFCQGNSSSLYHITVLIFV
ncbi:hypothetical protein MKW92_038566 [Papaver armeniacum]|nr:hypothetical protein MKW92_038566 [Papaver armeniacum]